MHDSVRAFVAGIVSRDDLAGRSTLEVGSYDVNGSVRRLFSGRYVGVDMRSGPGVDVVAAGYALPFRDDTFDVVVSTEMLEHDRRPWRSIAEMARVVRPGGRVIVTCRGYDKRGCFPIHDYPDDLWRFSTEGVRVLLEECGLDRIRSEPDPEAPGVLAEARKPVRRV